MFHDFRGADGHVGGQPIGAGRGGQVLELGRRARDRHDPGPGAGQALGRRAPDAAAGTGDERDSALERHRTYRAARWCQRSSASTSGFTIDAGSRPPSTAATFSAASVPRSTSDSSE